MRFKQGLLLTLGLAAAGAAYAQCNVSVSSILPNGQMVLKANCGTGAITGINWLRDGGSITPGGIALSPAVDNTDIHFTTSTLAGTHSYTATGATGAHAPDTADVAAGQAATVTIANPSLTVAANAGGTVASTPAGINACTSSGGTCTNTFSSGSVVSLAATADSGYVFNGWSGDCSGSGACNLGMTTSRNVAAIFGATPVPGACGTANGVAIASAPSSNLCANGTTPSSVTEGSTTYTWSCTGLNGGSVLNCTAPRIVAGTCGSAHGATGLTTAPSGLAACATGSLNGSVTAADPNYTWTCAGANGGTTSPTCSGAMASVNGTCGTPAASATPPASGLCTQGNPTSVTTNATTYSWGCNGQAGGTSTAAGACTSPRIVNGVCGTANNVAVATAPTTGLCSAGTASAVSGTGPFTWTCADINDSTPANCSAPLLAAGSCPPMPANYSVPPMTGASGDWNYNSSTNTTIQQIAVGNGLAMPFTINKTAYPMGHKIADAVGGSKSYTISKCPGGTDGPVDGQNGTTSVNGDSRADNCQKVGAYVRYKETSGASATYYNNTTNLLLQTTCFLPTTTAQGSSTPATYYLNILNTGTTPVSIQLQNQAQLN